MWLVALYNISKSQNQCEASSICHRQYLISFKQSPCLYIIQYILELSINVWKKKDAANHSWFEWSTAHFCSQMLKSLSFLSMLGQKKWCSKLALTWMIYSTFFQSYTEKLYLNRSADCRGGDVLGYGYKLSKQQDQRHLVFRWWNCNLREQR